MCIVAARRTIHTTVNSECWKTRIAPSVSTPAKHTGPRNLNVTQPRNCFCKRTKQTIMLFFKVHEWITSCTRPPHRGRSTNDRRINARRKPRTKTLARLICLRRLISERQHRATSPPCGRRPIARPGRQRPRHKANTAGRRVISNQPGVQPPPRPDPVADMRERGFSEGTDRN